VSEGNAERSKFRRRLTNIRPNLHINCLELLIIVVSLRTWSKYMTGKRILFFCDNEASVQVLNSAHTRDAFML
jgi:hypothetical protein